MIHPARIHRLNDKLVQRTGTFVVYWMQQSQRAEENHALEYAIIRANELHLPVAVVFGLMEKYPEATDRHVAFMLQGLEETFRTLERRGISAWIGRGNPAEVAIQTGKRAAVVVCDMGYLRHQAEWRARVAEEVGCEVVEVESDILVPVELASDHAEYMARTLRPKLRKRLDEFLQPVPEIPVVTRWPGDRQLAEGFVRDVPAIHSAHVLRFAGGTRAAKQRLRDFIKKSLPVYEAHSNQPQTDDTSVLSPYLHFGQISPVYIACEIQRVSPDSRFLEQLIIRRELSINFVWFTPDYDRFSCLPDWARQTLRQHATDPRPIVYTREQLDAAKTHDPYWNAAMNEMRSTGFMHNYMRMYWGKKILEWSPSPEEAFETTLALNNHYFFDGRDPNSYAGVAWIFGKHDQAWQERPIFGKVRYMNAAGLERKCDIAGYVKKVARLM